MAQATPQCTLADILRFRPDALSDGGQCRLLLYQVREQPSQLDTWRSCPTLRQAAQHSQGPRHAPPFWLGCYATCHGSRETQDFFRMSCLLKGLRGVQVASRVEALHAAGLWHGRLNAETVLLQGASSVQLLGTCSTGAQAPARGEDAVEHDSRLLSTDRPGSLEELTAMWCASKVSRHLAASCCASAGVLRLPTYWLHYQEHDSVGFSADEQF